MNAESMEFIKKNMSLSGGICGGKGNRSFYFYDSRDSSLLYLDPHIMVGNNENNSNYKWISKDDGFIARDLNNNGQIDFRGFINTSSENVDLANEVEDVLDKYAVAYNIKRKKGFGKKETKEA